MFENAKDINELIEMIFNEVLTVKLCKEEDGKKLEGYYVSLQHISKVELINSPQIVRLFYNTMSKALRCYGSTNENDKENNISEGWMYLYEGLVSALVTDNDKLEEKLRVNDVQDAIRIVNDEKLCSSLAKYVITFVEMKFKTYHKRKDNPDYYFDGKEFKKIDYLYLDDYDSESEEVSPYEKLHIEKFDSKTGDLTEYILDTYFDKLTSKQQLFCKCFIEFGTDKSGYIRDLDDNILYIPQEVTNYKAVIRKRLLKCIEQDSNIQVRNGRFIY